MGISFTVHPAFILFLVVEFCTQMYITVYYIWPNKTAHRHWQHFIDSITEKVGEESARLSIFSLIDCFESISVPEKFQPHHTRTSSFQRTLSPQGVHIEGLENYGVKYYHLVSTHLSAMFYFCFIFVLFWCFNDLFAFKILCFCFRFQWNILSIFYPFKLYFLFYIASFSKQSILVLARLVCGFVES